MTDDWDDIKVNRRKGDKVYFESTLLQQISDGIDFIRAESKEILQELDIQGIDEIVLDIKKQEHINNCEYRGVNDFAESSIKYQIKVYCNPIHKVQIRRDSLRCIMLILNKHNISIPYNQMDIHNK